MEPQKKLNIILNKSIEIAYPSMYGPYNPYKPSIVKSEIITGSPLKELIDSLDFFPVLMVPSKMKSNIEFPPNEQIHQAFPSLLKPPSFHSSPPAPPIPPIKPANTKSIYKNKLHFSPTEAGFSSRIFFGALMFFWGSTCVVLKMFQWGEDKHPVPIGIWIFCGIILVYQLRKFFSKKTFELTPVFIKTVEMSNKEYAPLLNLFEKKQTQFLKLQEIYNESAKKYNFEKMEFYTKSGQYQNYLQYYGNELIKKKYYENISAQEAPTRNRNVPKKGKTENDFLVYLEKHFSGKIQIDMALGSFSKPYSPDFTYINKTNNLHIDIEIDEMYDLVDKKPIHFKGGDDERRNQYFLKSNWVIIRFAEEQIQKHPEDCCKYIQFVENYICNPFKNKIEKTTLPIIKCWTYEEAYLNALKNKR